VAEAKQKIDRVLAS
jgi:predicted transcriptional regulator